MSETGDALAELLDWVAEQKRTADPEFILFFNRVCAAWEKERATLGQNFNAACQIEKELQTLRSEVERVEEWMRDHRRRLLPEHKILDKFADALRLARGEE